jgi:hypothetical protein
LNNIEDILKKLVEKDQINIPDENEMWRKITIKQRGRNHSFMKSASNPKFVFSVLLFAIVLTATPVLANYSNEILEWMRNINRPGVVTSIENGFGQEINKTIRNEVGVLEVHNIVSDQNGTTINFSLDMEHDHPVSAAKFNEALLIMESGKEIKLEETIVYNDKSDKLVGFLHTNEKIESDQNVSLLIDGIRETKVEKVNLQQQQSQYERIPVHQSGISEIEFISSDYKNDGYHLDYLIKLEEQNDIEYASLTFALDGQSILHSGVTYKRPQPNVIRKSASINIKENDLKDIDMILEYQDTVGYHPDTWKLNFEYNYAHAKKSTYIIKVDQELEMGNQKVQFNEITITPSRIKLYYEKENTNYNSDMFYVQYNNIKLQIGDQELEGYFSDEDYLSFETQDVLQEKDFKEISLILTDARVSYEGGKQNKIQLTNISSKPKAIQMDLKGFLVDITYYRKGSDLVVVSESINQQFGGITQSVIYKNDKRIFAETRTNDGLSSNNRQVEVFKNITDKELTLHVFLYTVNEERPKTVNLK